MEQYIPIKVRDCETLNLIEISVEPDEIQNLNIRHLELNNLDLNYLPKLPKTLKSLYINKTYINNFGFNNIKLLQLQNSLIIKWN